MPNEKLERALSMVMEGGLSPKAAARAAGVDVQELFDRIRVLKTDADNAAGAIPSYAPIPKSLLQEQEFFQRKIGKQADEFLEKNGFTTWATKRKR